MRRPLTILASLALLALGTLVTAAPVLAAPCDGSGAALGNGGFETPPVAADSYNVFTTETAPWQTTDVLGQIEVWGDGFLGVPAYAGNAFAELNANSAGTLYQDVVSTPGATMSWTLAHRGRGGDDTMEVLIGDANVADVNGSAGWDYTSPDLTDGVSAWGTHGDDYVVPAGQTCTRFAFRAVSTGSGDEFDREFPRRGVVHGDRRAGTRAGTDHEGHAAADRHVRRDDDRRWRSADASVGPGDARRDRRPDRARGEDSAGRPPLSRTPEIAGAGQASAVGGVRLSIRVVGAACTAGIVPSRPAW